MATAAAAAAATPDRATLVEETPIRVRLKGHVAKQGWLNGRVGTRAAFLPKLGAYVVTLDSTADALAGAKAGAKISSKPKRVFVKPENMDAIAPGGAATLGAGPCGM